MSVEDVMSYLKAPLSNDEESLLETVRDRFKALKSGSAEWSNVIPECQGWPMEGEWMRGLLLKVTRFGATSKPGQYNISNTVLQHYTTLLLNRAIEYPDMCWRAIFPILAKFNKEGVDTGAEACISRTLEKEKQSQSLNTLRYVVQMMYDERMCYYFMLVEDLVDDKFILFDSLPPHRDDETMKVYELTKKMMARGMKDVGVKDNVDEWEVINGPCKEQVNGHDCGVFIMGCIDLLTIRGETVEFCQDYVDLYRDKCLLSILKGKMLHFPHGTSIPEQKG